MSTELYVWQGTTYVCIDIAVNSPYAHIVGDFTKCYLAEWDYNKRFKYKFISRKYSYYDKKQSRLYLPIEYCKIFTWYANEVDIPVVINKLVPNISRKISLNIHPQWKDKPWQTDAIEYLVNGCEYRRGLQFQTGKGKTYCAIKAMVKIGLATLIIVPNLVDQWEKSLKSITDVGNDLYILQGFKSIQALTECDWMPKVILGSINTIRSYIKNEHPYNTLKYNFNQFVEHYGIGTKIMDEVHLNFHALTLLDLHTNIKNNIYLTATFTNGNATTRKLFDIIYPERMRYGASNYKKYINVVFYNYCISVSEKKCITSNGYSHARYETQLLKKVSKFNDFMSRILVPIINMHFLNIRLPKQKCLIFFSTIEMIKHVSEYLKKEYPDLKIVEYITNSPESNLDDGNDIILTTPQSAGCGTDIKNLRTAINTISELSPTAIEQKRGRLRELSDSDPIYIDMYNSSLIAHSRHHYQRAIAHRSKAKSYYESTI